MTEGSGRDAFRRLSTGPARSYGDVIASISTLSALRWSAALLLVVMTAACGDDADSSAPAGLPPQAERGFATARDNGCFACHGDRGFGNGVAPTWEHVAGSQVQLKDGSVVTADDAYLARAISDPGAQIRAGATLVMPQNTLTTDQIADVVAYIDAIR